ncbi:unnamed protein product, partial [Laminaria digitata]
MRRESELFRQQSEEVRMERFAEVAAREELRMDRDDEVEAAQEDELDELLRRRLQHMRTVEAESHLLRLQNEAEAKRMQQHSSSSSSSGRRCSSSNNMRGLFGLATPDAGGISRSLLRRQELRWACASGVV